MNYAVIKISGKQYKVSEGEVLEVTRLALEKAAKIEVADVLLTSIDGTISVGTPLVDKAKVELEVMDHFRGPKIEIMKFKSKVRYRKHTGFRQEMTRVKVNKVGVSGKKTEVPAEELKKAPSKVVKPRASKTKASK